MALLQTPDDTNVLGQVRETVEDEIDNQVKGPLIEKWINLEIKKLTRHREFKFLFQKTELVIAIADSQGYSTLQLPTDMKKIYRIFTRDSVVTGDDSGRQESEFKQGPHFELFWNITRKAYDATFINLRNETAVNVEIWYYVIAARLLLDTAQTRIPEYFIDVLVEGVLLRCYRKLGDMDEYVVTERRYAKGIQDIMDDDAREPSLPSSMSPSRHQTADQYEKEHEEIKYDMVQRYE